MENKRVSKETEPLRNTAHTGCLSGNALEDVVDKGVEDGHRLVRDTSVRVHLLEDYEGNFS